MIGNNRSTGVTQVNVTDPSTKVVKECTTHLDILHAKIQYLPELFLCADNTPLLYFTLLNDFGFAGDTISGDESTAGIYIYIYIPAPDTDEHTITYFKCMKRHDHITEKLLVLLSPLMTT